MDIDERKNRQLPAVIAGIGDSLIGQVKAIAEIPSDVAELSKIIANEIAKDPVGAAATYVNLLINPMARWQNRKTGAWGNGRVTDG